MGGMDRLGSYLLFGCYRAANAHARRPYDFTPLLLLISSVCLSTTIKQYPGTIDDIGLAAWAHQHHLLILLKPSYELAQALAPR